MISVIIPTLNEEKYIGPTLKALKSQDYTRKYEIILADGGSRDKTVKIAKNMVDKVVVVNERGIAKGRNTGARAAKGDMLLFVDADTILLFNALEEVEKAFKNKKIVCASCPILPTTPQAKYFMLYWGFNQFVKTSIRTRTPQIAGLFFACRKKAFDRVGGFDENLETLEDFDLSRKLSKIGKTSFIEDTLVLTSHRRIKEWGRIKGVRKYIKFYLSYIVTGKGGSTDEYKPIR